MDLHVLSGMLNSLAGGNEDEVARALKSELPVFQRNKDLSAISADSVWAWPKALLPIVEKALRFGALEVLRQIQDKGYDIRNYYHASSERFALHVAAAAGQSVVIAWLLEIGADVRVRGAGGNSPLHSACAVSLDAVANPQGMAEVVRLLAKAGVNVDERRTDGMTPLLLACSGPRCPAVVRTLLECGADPNLGAQVYSYKTPLLFAVDRAKEAPVDGDAMQTRLRIARDDFDALLEHGADPSHLHKECPTDLMAQIILAGDHALDLARKVLDAGWQRSEGKGSPLMVAVNWNAPLIAKELIGRGFYCEGERMPSAGSALDGADIFEVAHQMDRPEILEALMLHGVDLEMKMRSGVTRRQAIEIGGGRCLELLRSLDLSAALNESFEAGDLPARESSPKRGLSL